MKGRYQRFADRDEALDAVGLPSPGAVVGDQVATDGLLAWRLGYVFLQLVHDRAVVPAGPRLLAVVGLPVRRLLFHKG